MNVNILFAARPERWRVYERPLTVALSDALTGTGVAFDLRTDFAPDQVDYIVYAPNSPLQDFTPYTRLKAVLNLWAGVEAITGNQTLKVPLARMVDHGLTQGMTEWVVGHVLRHHLGMDAHIHGLGAGWPQDVPPLAPDRRVVVLGLGVLGLAAAGALAGLGFDVTGWSRTAKAIDGLRTLHGSEGLREALSGAEIIVLLLPSTAATENMMDARALALMPRGAVIINPGRGELIDDDALLVALDSGHISHATLDVFRIEPLPVGHPFRAHPRVTVTPHIASETRAGTASMVIAENIRRGEAGEGFLHLVDRAVGY